MSPFLLLARLEGLLVAEPEGALAVVEVPRHRGQIGSVCAGEVRIDIQLTAVCTTNLIEEVGLRVAVLDTLELGLAVSCKNHHDLHDTRALGDLDGLTVDLSVPGFRLGLPARVLVAVLHLVDGESCRFQLLDECVELGLFGVATGTQRKRECDGSGRKCLVQLHSCPLRPREWLTLFII